MKLYPPLQTSFARWS